MQKIKYQVFDNISPSLCAIIKYACFINTSFYKKKPSNIRVSNCNYSAYAVISLKYAFDKSTCVDAVIVLVSFTAIGSSPI